jgi:hypothetical protein
MHTSAMIKGTVSSFQQRTEQINTGTGPRSLVVWDFRIEQRDSTGQPMPRVAVEMRGRSFIGSINNGDVVEIDARFRPGQVLQVRRLRNLTSGAVVTAKGAQLMRLSRFISLVIFVVLVIVIVMVFRSLPSGFR